MHNAWWKDDDKQIPRRCTASIVATILTAVSCTAVAALLVALSTAILIESHGRLTTEQLPGLIEPFRGADRTISSAIVELNSALESLPEVVQAELSGLAPDIDALTVDVANGVPNGASAIAIALAKALMRMVEILRCDPLITEPDCVAVLPESASLYIDLNDIRIAKLQRIDVTFAQDAVEDMFNSTAVQDVLEAIASIRLDPKMLEMAPALEPAVDTMVDVLDPVLVLLLWLYWMSILYLVVILFAACAAPWTPRPKAGGAAGLGLSCLASSGKSTAGTVRVCAKPSVHLPACCGIMALLIAASLTTAAVVVQTETASAFQDVDDAVLSGVQEVNAVIAQLPREVIDLFNAGSRTMSVAVDDTIFPGLQEVADLPNKLTKSLRDFMLSVGMSESAAGAVVVDSVVIPFPGDTTWAPRLPYPDLDGLQVIPEAAVPSLNNLLVPVVDEAVAPLYDTADWLTTMSFWLLIGPCVALAIACLGPWVPKRVVHYVTFPEASASHASGGGGGDDRQKRRRTRRASSAARELGGITHHHQHQHTGHIRSSSGTSPSNSSSRASAAPPTPAPPPKPPTSGYAGASLAPPELPLGAPASNFNSARSSMRDTSPRGGHPSPALALRKASVQPNLPRPPAGSQAPAPAVPTVTRNRALSNAAPPSGATVAGLEAFVSGAAGPSFALPPRASNAGVAPPTVTTSPTDDDDDAPTGRTVEGLEAFLGKK
jgi:hypothetical protein